MSLTALLARIATTGSVAGVGPGDSTERVYAAVGDSCVADRQKRSLRLDYGLVEFYLFDDVCEGIGVQVHRIRAGGRALVPDALGIPVDDVVDGVSFDSFREEVTRERGHLDEDRHQSGYRCYRVRGSHVLVFVFDGIPPDDGRWRIGDIWSIVISTAG